MIKPIGAMLLIKKIETGEKIIVGVNKFQSDKKNATRGFKISLLTQNNTIENRKIVLQ